MRNHKSQYRMAKERDYVAMESRCFFGDATAFIFQLKFIVKDQDCNRILDDLKEELEKHSVKNIEPLFNRARELSFRNFNNQDAAAMLMLLAMLRNFFYLWSKAPAEYDRELRPPYAPGA